MVKTYLLSNKTWILLLDSLLQEVCINSSLVGLLILSFPRLECLSCQSQPFLYRAKESLFHYGVSKDKRILKKIGLVVWNWFLNQDS